MTIEKFEAQSLMIYYEYYFFVECFEKFERKDLKTMFEDLLGK
jgi:hypothetical protein